MATVTGTAILVDSGHNLILLAGSVSSSPGNFFAFNVASTATVTRDGLSANLGSLEVTDSISVTDDGSGNVSSIVATSVQPL